MKEKVKILLSIVIFLIILFSIFFSFYLYSYNERLKKRQITQLIIKYYDQKEYETAKKFTEELLIKYYSDKELIDILDRINEAEKNNDYRPLAVTPNIDLSELKNIRKLLDILKARLDKLSDKQADIQPKIIEREKTIIQRNGNDRIIDEFELAKLINEGKIFYCNRKFPEAINCFRNAVVMDENSVDGNVYLGASLFELNPDNDKILEESAWHCKKTLELDKTSELAHFTLGRIYENSKNEKDAIDELKETLRINPDNYLADFNLGRINFNLKEYTDAEKYFSNLTEIKKDFPDGFYFLAMTELELNKTSDAKSNLNKCLSFDPKFYKAYLKLAEISIKENSYGEAISNYNKLISLNKNYQYYFSAGDCYLKLGDKENAKNNYLCSLEINSLKIENEKKSALSAYEKIIQIETENKNFNQALIYSHKGIDALKEKGIAFYLTSADLNIKLGKTNDAVNDYLKAIECKMSRQEAIYLKLGGAYELLRDRKKAIASYKKALEINRDFPDAYYNLGKIYYAENNFKESKEIFTKLLDKNPDYSKKDEVESILQQIKDREVK